MHHTGIHSSFLWLSYFGSFGSSMGDFHDSEWVVYENNRGSIPNTTLNADRPDDERISDGIDLVLFPSIIRFRQTRGFNLTGIQFGIKGRYSVTTIVQSIYNNGSDFDEIGKGNLMEYSSWQAGPSIDLILSPRENSFNLMFHTFIIGGQVYKGELNAAAALRDSGVEFNRSEYHTGIKGRIYTVGSGIFFVINRYIPVTVGLLYYYSWANLEFDNKLPLYGNIDENKIASSGVELSIGFHL